MHAIAVNAARFSVKPSGSCRTEESSCWVAYDWLFRRAGRPPPNYMAVRSSAAGPFGRRASRLCGSPGVWRRPCHPWRPRFESGVGLQIEACPNTPRREIKQARDAVGAAHAFVGETGVPDWEEFDFSPAPRLSMIPAGEFRSPLVWPVLRARGGHACVSARRALEGFG
jgi:hypothetical protein